MYWLRCWGRRVPLPFVVLAIPTAVALLAAQWQPVKRPADAIGTWHWLGPVTIPGIGLIFLGAGAVALLITRTIARRSPEGPLTVTGVIDTTPPDAEPGPPADPAPPRQATDPAGGTSPRTTRGLRVETILRDRLAAAGTAPRGLIPASGSLQLTAEQPVGATSEDAYGLLTRLGLGAWRTATQRLGWRISGTLLHTDDPVSPFGLSVVVEHVATGRHVFTRTVWAATPEKAARTTAYEIIAWRFLRLAPRSTRSALHWRPTAKSLGAYEEAAYCAAGNRFDEAVYRANLGLAADPANHALRRLLGECYEWLGHFESALRTYASGLAMIHDDQNGWSRSTLDRTRGPRWPRGGRARPDAWLRQLSRARSHTNGQRVNTGLVWRYTIMLLFADQWIDRWIAALERHETHRRQQLGHRVAERWSGEVIDLDSRLTALSRQRLELSNTPARDEEARRLRGFFHQRYHSLLTEEYPLLNRMWFSEYQEHHRPFDPPAKTTPPPRPLPDLLDAERRRFPWRRGAGHPHRRIRPRAGGSAQLEHWVGELQWLFGDLLERYLPEHPDAPSYQLQRGQTPTSTGMVSVEVLRRLGLPMQAGNLREVSAALCDPDGWTRLRLSQQLVGAAASWAAHHLLQLTPSDARHRKPDGTGTGTVTGTGTGTGKPRTLDAIQSGRLLALSEQLDLRAFIYRATLFELDCPPYGPVPRGLLPVSSTLRDLLWLTARFRYLERLHRLAGNGTQQQRLEGLRRDTAAHARRISRNWAAVARLRPAPEEWSVWYYAACTQAAVIPPVPEPEPEPATSAHRSTPYKALLGWVRDNDPYAEYGVRALNQAILVRRRNGVTLVEAGARDWMLRRDPNLHNLRAHPRFQRWVSATFCIAHHETESGNPDDRTALAHLQSQDWDNDGVFGTESRWNPWNQDWCAIHDTYLVERVTDLALMIAARWRALRTRPAAQRDAAWERDIVDLMISDVEAWRHLAAYRLFFWNPILRHTAMEALTRTAGHRTLRAPFPSCNDPLLRPQRLRHAALDETLEPLVRAAESATLELGDAPTAGPLWCLSPPRRSTGDLTTVCEDAANRWETLLGHFASCSILYGNGLVAAPEPAPTASAGKAGSFP